MKKLICVLCVGIFVFCFSACKKTRHSVRFRNGCPETINNVLIGAATLGNVTGGQTSDYQTIPAGDFSISGTTVSGRTLSGSGTISGKGKHKWTVTLSSAAQISIAED